MESRAMKWIMIALLVVGFGLGCLLGLASARAEEAPPAETAAVEETAQSPGEGLVTIAAFTPVEDTIGIQRGTELTIGTTTALGGYFGTDAWGNNTSDLDVRSLLHGYATVAWTRTLGLAMNGVAVSGVETAEQGDGSRIYTIYLTEGLTYNDGTPITAKDYVFSVLLNSSPVLKAIGGTPNGFGHLVGYDAYQLGQSNTLYGVRLVSDYAFSLQVAGEYLPFFYGLAMLNVTPYPMSVIAPGCDIVDDEAGAYISGDFTPEVLQKTLLDPETGYERNPKVTSGPYALESFDASTSTATFVINELYKGNYEGQRPHIERLIFKQVQNETMISQLESGEVGLLNKVVGGDAVLQGRTMAMEEGKAQAATYLRTGFSFLAFACESGATSSQAVRRAVAMSFDKDAFTTQTAGTSARRVYGYYGLGQWMALYTADEANGNAALNMPEELSRLDVPLDLVGAKALLEADGWTLDAAGGPYTEGTRYRQGETGIEPLEIKWAKTKQLAITRYFISIR